MIVKIVVPTSGSLLRGGATLRFWPECRLSRPGIGFRGCERRTDDSCLIAELRGPNLSLYAQQRGEDIEALADGTAQDEQVRPQEGLHALEVDVHPLDPGVPVQPQDGLDVRRGEFLRVHAVQLHVTELRVGEQPPAREERGADAGPE